MRDRQNLVPRLVQRRVVRPNGLRYERKHHPVGPPYHHRYEWHF